MIALRILIVVGLLGGLFCFARYVWSGDVRWRRFGLRITGWTVGDRDRLLHGAVRAAACSR